VCWWRPGILFPCDAGPPSGRRRVLAALSTAALAVYVASEDDYRGNGISRWEAYDAGGLTVAAALAGAALCALAVFGTKRSGRVSLVAGSAGVAVAAFFFVAFAENTLN